MIAQPIRERHAANSARGQSHDDVHYFNLFSFYLETVQGQKNVHRHECNPFVAIDKRVVAGQTITVFGREAGEVSILIVRECVHCASKRGFQHALVAQSGLAAVLCELPRM